MREKPSEWLVGWRGLLMSFAHGEASATIVNKAVELDQVLQD